MRAQLTGRLGAVVLAATMSIAAGCSGPPVPDVALCRDVIHRLCLPVRCSVVTRTLMVDDSCEPDLQIRTGCHADDFFLPESLTRERVLECRLPLLRAGLDLQQHPDCEDVDEVMERCPDLTELLRGPPA